MTPQQPSVGSAAPRPRLAQPLVAPQASTQPTPPTADRLAAIRQRNELLVCIWPEYFAISYRNPRNGEMEGIDIDMARSLATRLSARLTFVETNFSEFMDRVEDGTCDIAMMAVGITPGRAQRVAFSKPYMASPVYAVTTRTNTRIQAWRDIDSPGTVVAVAAGTVMEPLMRETLRNAEVMVVAAPRTREGEILSGRADVFMSDFPYTRRMVLMHDWARVIDPPGRFGDTLYAYAVARGDQAWLNEVNAFLERTRVDGSLNRFAQRHGLVPILLP
ncbi:substrate-binding periplasmic protein [Falsiroseomonas selenitidurans]|uniref:Amino acid ABC transporter substrate-binding protein n=1 Tax=Falsiroseomonas selenitidurans TaxID=2716335 RepID=A0ABX1EBE8_9PROT|nr:ABC transporter substrate-binding protein [Falsiroseomonas selenitidurans]NKC34559.1 amino acid ABC transporter substrate-binding protein [Falsiroseomonas selenitidurans]